MHTLPPPACQPLRAFSRNQLRPIQRSFDRSCLSVTCLIFPNPEPRTPNPVTYAGVCVLTTRTRERATIHMGGMFALFRGILRVRSRRDEFLSLLYPTAVPPSMSGRCRPLVLKWSLILETRPSLSLVRVSTWTSTWTHVLRASAGELSCEQNSGEWVSGLHTAANAQPTGAVVVYRDTSIICVGMRRYTSLSPLYIVIDWFCPVMLGSSTLGALWFAQLSQRMSVVFVVQSRSCFLRSICLFSGIPKHIVSVFLQLPSFFTTLRSTSKYSIAGRNGVWLCTMCIEA